MCPCAITMFVCLHVICVFILLAMVATSPPLQTGIYGFISFDIFFIIGTLDPWDFVDDVTFLFILRLSVAIFFSVPVEDCHVAGFWHLPAYTPWLMLPPFGETRRLGDSSLFGGASRGLAAGDGIAVRFNVVTNKAGGVDTTDTSIDKLMDADVASMLSSFLCKYRSWPRNL